MSRSITITPFFGIADAPSEKQDKRIWHKRWQVQQRTKQGSFASLNLKNHLPEHVIEASNIRSMAIDGRFYSAESDHQSFANKQAGRKARTPWIIYL